MFGLWGRKKDCVDSGVSELSRHHIIQLCPTTCFYVDRHSFDRVTVSLFQNTKKTLEIELNRDQVNLLTRQLLSSYGQATHEKPAY